MTTPTQPHTPIPPDALALPLTVRLTTPPPYCLALIGCGGTGSWLAEALVALALHQRQRQPDSPLVLVFIDGDTVEARNVGRQNFYPYEVGRNKAEALASRYSLLFGLRIHAGTRYLLPAEPGRRVALPAVLRRGPTGPGTLLIGALDDKLANGGRQALAQLVTAYRYWWLDSGNARTAGQLLLGQATRAEQIDGRGLPLGMVDTLPAPHIQAPDLLTAREDAAPASCAEVAAAAEQSLLINRQMAALAAHLVSQWLSRRLTLAAVETSLDPPVTHHQAVTRRWLSGFMRTADAS